MTKGLRKEATKPPVTAEMMVTIMILGGLLARSANIEKAEPPLKNNQLTQSRIVP